MNAIFPTQGAQAGLIRRAQASDIAAVVRIHCAAFPDSFLTLLGPRFLTIYYNLLREDPGGILLVHDPAQIDAFVAGFLRPERFYRRMKAARWTMLASLAAALKNRPRLAGQVFYHVKRMMLGKARQHPGECELSSLAVSPDAWSRGIGTALVRAFLDAAWSAGAPAVYLTTDATGNGRTNSFYQRIGFELRQCFLQYRGRLLNEYVIRRAVQ
jgi:ribosomal protein S18 acetylase RimI-like enzyme